MTAVTKKQRTRDVVRSQLRVHERDGTLPTTARFLFYELESQGLAAKPTPDDQRPNKRRSIGWPPGSQDITDALTHLRDEGVVPWDWIVDTERSAAVFGHAPTIADYVRSRLDRATLNPWSPAPPPLIVCEDRGTAEVLEETARAYACPIAGLKGQTAGFLRTRLTSVLRSDRSRMVFYLGDLDRCGLDIEANARRVLSESGRIDRWHRIALTADDVARKGLTPIYRRDGRDGAVREAWELQALGQLALVASLRRVLDRLLPEPLERVHEREGAERQQFAEYLDRYDGDGDGNGRRRP